MVLNKKCMSKCIVMILLFCMISVSCFSQKESRLPCVFSSNLIENPTFELNNGCNINPNSCGGSGNIGNCVPNWNINHGTPHLFTDSCSSISFPNTNSFVRCFSSVLTGQGEGVFQLVSLTPGVTYQMCLWIRNHALFPVGTAVISLGNNNSTTGLPQNQQCFGLPGARMDIYQENSNNFANGWNRRLFRFTMPLNANFDRIIFWAAGGARIGFDNISLVPLDDRDLCLPNWTVTNPGEQIEGGVHTYTDFIRIESSNPNGLPITTNGNSSVILQAGNCITIKPGFNSAVNGFNSAVYRIVDTCVIKPNESCCFADPCPMSSDLMTATESELYKQMEGQTSHDSWELRIFPNPVSGNDLYISTNENIAEVRIMDRLGKLISFNKGNRQHIDISPLESGLYFIKAVSQSGQTQTQVIIRE